MNGLSLLLNETSDKNSNFYTFFKCVFSIINKDILWIVDRNKICPPKHWYGDNIYEIDANLLELDYSYYKELNNYKIVNTDYLRKFSMFFSDQANQIFAFVPDQVNLETLQKYFVDTSNFEIKFVDFVKTFEIYFSSMDNGGWNIFSNNKKILDMVFRQKLNNENIVINRIEL